MSRFAQTRKKHDSHLLRCTVKRNQNSSSAPGWSGLVAIVCALATRELDCSSWAGLGVGMVVACVPYCCAAVMSVVVVVVVAVAVVLLFVYVCLRVLVCSLIQETLCSVTRAGCLPPAQTLLCQY